VRSRRHKETFGREGEEARGLHEENDSLFVLVYLVLVAVYKKKEILPLPFEFPSYISKSPSLFTLFITLPTPREL